MCAMSSLRAAAGAGPSAGQPLPERTRSNSSATTTVKYSLGKGDP